MTKRLLQAAIGVGFGDQLQEPAEENNPVTAAKANRSACGARLQRRSFGNELKPSASQVAVIWYRSSGYLVHGVSNPLNSPVRPREPFGGLSDSRVFDLAASN